MDKQPIHDRGLGVRTRLYLTRMLGKKRMAQSIKGLEMLISYNNKRPKR